LTETPVPNPEDGEVLVRIGYLSVDPYLRGMLRETDPEDRPWTVAFDKTLPLGTVLPGMAVGEVVESNHQAYDRGEVVTGELKWADYCVARGETLRHVDTDVAPPPAWLGVLGRPGRAAYVGLFEYGHPQPGETVVISAAAGAVGTTAGQLASLAGCRTVGTTGADEKATELVDELGYDAAINYRTEDVREAIEATCPEGVDVYLDNVGGTTSDAVFANLNHEGRVAISGQTALYNDEETPTGPRHSWRILLRRARVEGFSLLDHEHEFDEIGRRLVRLVDDGALLRRETITRGLERAPETFVGLSSGDNVGKQLVAVNPHPE